MNKEIWKDIPGYENYYQISNTGKVKSFVSNKILKPITDKDGYLRVCLCVNQKRKSHIIHRIVAKVFIPNPQNKPHINHLDFNITNNCVSNLEWCTPKENILYSYNEGRINPPKYWKNKFSYNHHSSKEVLQYDINGTVINKYGSAHEAMRQTGIDNKHISGVARGERKTAGGFIWKYSNEEKLLNRIP
jgi:hypothetical protein